MTLNTHSRLFPAVLAGSLLWTSEIGRAHV